MKARPILFSGEMVRAILDGRKTQTRRKMSNDLVTNMDAEEGVICDSDGDWHRSTLFCPYGQPGDRLWVRETFAAIEGPHISTVVYRAESGMPGKPSPCDLVPGMPAKWTPSIFMRPRFSRITLEIVSVRVERLMEISESDAQAEGIDLHGYGSLTEGIAGREHRIEYAALWDRINGPGSWDANPWVWVVEFKRVTL